MPYRRQRPAGLPVHPGDVDQAEPVAWFPAEVQVAGHAHQRNEVDLLVDRGDAGLLGVEWPAEAHRFAVVAHLAGVGLVHPGQHLDEGGLAGAVLAHQRVYLARGHGQADAVECPYAREALGHVTDGEDGRRWRARVGPVPVSGGWLLVMLAFQRCAHPVC